MHADNKIDWNGVLINASIEAMQGIQESGKIGFAADLVPETLAALSVKIGKAMVKELKKEICGKEVSC